MILSHYKKNIVDILAAMSSGDCERIKNLGDGHGDCKVEGTTGEGVGEGVTEEDQSEDSDYIELIRSLASPDPDQENGHFWSLSTVYECSRCQRLIPVEIWHNVGCLNRRFTITPVGDVVDVHDQAPNWNLTRHIIQLKKTYRRDWKLIYWRLWLECHYLFCSVCGSYYSLIDLAACRNHATEAVFNFVNEEGVSTIMHPVGRFACCDARAYRYESVERSKDIFGCRTMQHIPQSKTVARTCLGSVHEITNNDQFSSVDISSIKTQSNTQILHYGIVKRGLWALRDSNEEVTRIGRGDAIEEHHPLRPKGWKNGTDRTDENALSVFINALTEPHDPVRKRPKSKAETPRKRPVNDVLCSEGCCLPLQDLNSEDKYFNRPIRYSKRTNRHKKTRCGLQSDQWIDQFSTRYNQDRQRQHEDIFFNILNVVLTKKAEESKVNIDDPLPESSSSTSKNDVDIDSSETVERKDRSEGLSSDDFIRSTSEESLSSYCTTICSSVRVRHSRTSSVWNSHSPLSGSYMRIETELRDVCSSLRLVDLETERKRQADSEINPILAKINERMLKPRKQPTFTVQQYPHFIRKHNVRSFYKNETSTAPATKTKTLQVPLSMERKPDDTICEIWCFDQRSQELDYLSAAYMPLQAAFNAKHFKYSKTIKNDLSNDWGDLVDLEKSWNAFLWLFFENESLPNADEQTAARSTLDRYNSLKCNVCSGR